MCYIHTHTHIWDENRQAQWHGTQKHPTTTTKLHIFGMWPQPQRIVVWYCPTIHNILRVVERTKQSLRNGVDIHDVWVIVFICGSATTRLSRTKPTKSKYINDQMNCVLQMIAWMGRHMNDFLWAVGWYAIMILRSNAYVVVRSSSSSEITNKFSWTKNNCRLVVFGRNIWAHVWCRNKMPVCYIHRCISILVGTATKQTTTTTKISRRQSKYYY